jgi:DnaJ-class molecular chaperone
VLLGGQIKVHGMQEDTFMRLTVPECTQPETLLRLANHGIKDPLSGEHGDMLIKVHFILIHIFFQKRTYFFGSKSRINGFITNCKLVKFDVHSNLA